LLDQQRYRQLVSGQRPGWAAAVTRLFLSPVSVVYAVCISIRNFLYERGILTVHRAAVPVVSIGNITVGGTGKTPFVIYMCRLLAARGKRCAVLTRGYKAGKGTLADEPGVLAGSCGGAPVVVNPDRLAGAEQAVSQFGAEALVLDDGFQHRRLGRDVDIVTIDAMCPFGYGRLLPAGLLREWVGSLKRADAVVITRSDQVSAERLSAIEERLRTIRSGLVIARSVHRPVCVRLSGSKELGLEELKGKRVFAFCGIGNPEAFLGTLRGLGVELVGFRIYNDHCWYKKGNVAEIYAQAERLDVELIVTTEKDYSETVLASLAGRERSFGCLAVELVLVGGAEKISELIDRALGGTIGPRRAEAAGTSGQ